MSFPESQSTMEEQEMVPGFVGENLILYISNSTNFTEYTLPYDMTFNDDSIREVTLYSILFILAAVGNVPVFVTLFKNRHRKSRVNLMIMHLAIADLIVTFVMIPLEISWRITVTWIAGNVACKVLLFLRAFGPYLSSMVLVCISLDRYFAILHPFKVNDAQRRGKVMLTFAWIISTFCSVPQSFIFHVENHPEYPKFSQCVTFNFFPSQAHKMAYNLFCLLALYGGPLLIIVFCYSRILWEISRRSRETEDDLSEEQRYRGRLRLRRSDVAHIERARSRTLKMTVIIVLAFFWCWTPYVVMVLWYLFDPVSADKVDNRLQSSLFMFAVSNSCVNPLVYGSYVLNYKKILKRCLCRSNCPSPQPPSYNNTLISGTPRALCANRVHGNCRIPPGCSVPRRSISVNLRMDGEGTYPKVLAHPSSLHEDCCSLGCHSVHSSGTCIVRSNCPRMEGKRSFHSAG